MVPTTSSFRVSPSQAPATLEVYLSLDGKRGFFTLEHTASEEPTVSKSFPMWKAEVADLDGDGDDELVLGIWSNKKRHDEPQPHKTLWVLSWDGHWVETWRGSALARPMSDFATGDLDGDQRAELISLEKVGGRWVLAFYEWNGFGFSGLSHYALDDELENPRLASNPPTLRAEGREPTVLSLPQKTQ